MYKYVKLSPEDRCLLQGINQKLCELQIGDFDGQLVQDGAPVSDANPLPVELATGSGGLTDAELRASPVEVDGSGVTQPISASSLPLPTGASTAANQTTANTSLASIDSKTPASGQALMAASMPVVIASNQTAIPISTVSPGVGALNLGKQEEGTHTTGDLGVLALGMRSDTPSSTVSTTGRYTMNLYDNMGRLWVNVANANTIDQTHSHFRNTALSNTAVAVKAGAGNIYGYKFLNVNTTPVYIKVYNITQASVTVGTSTISKVWMVPASDGTTPGMVEITPDESALFYASTAITIAAVTGLADNNNTPPTTPIYSEVIYK